MQIALVEPYFSGSHAAWARGLAAASQHDIRLYTLPGRHWKWRLHGGAITLAEDIREAGVQPDAFLVTSMADLTILKAMLPAHWAASPFIYYFHENQLTYPWSPHDADPSLGRDLHYGFIQIASALAANQVWFNTAWHRDQFIHAAHDYMKRLPDCRIQNLRERLFARARVVHLGLNLSAIASKTPSANPSLKPPVVLWNHRWEYDKAPTEFFQTLYQFSEQGLNFNLIVTGESFEQMPAVFTEARERLSRHILHFGFIEDLKTYHTLLSVATDLPVTSRQDFFGISVVEAASAGVRPLLPHGLAYEEHFNEPELFYTPGNFSNALRQVLFSSDRTERYDGRALLRYDWSLMAPVYDTAFKAACEL